MRRIVLLPFLLASGTGLIASEPILVPRPAMMTILEGHFKVNSQVHIALTDRSLKKVSSFLRDALTPLLPEPPLVMPMQGVASGVIILSVDPGMDLPSGGYKLSIAEDHVELIGLDETGVFHGIQTLIQLLPGRDQAQQLPCLSITDHPRFGWRGMHLDVCRHFFDVDFVKKYIDLLARYKMNRFHWHLTEDQGWRIEIKKHPKLAEVGAWRSGSQIGPYSRREYDSIPYGGYYTQEEIRNVVAYAAARHITVVPEIEMPGHALAALASYPHLGCTGGPYEVQKGWGVFEDVFCAGNDSVFAMLEDVLTEVMDLFPGEYIHIGGDECPKERWKACTNCQARMGTHGLKDEHELQSYFIQRIEKFVNSKGRKIIGWDEILEGGLAPNAAVMSWRGTEGGIAAARSGHYAVMSPGSHCYFDHYQGDPANEPLAIGGFTTVQKVYSYEPIPAELNPAEQKFILGAQGNVWTEYILTPEHVEYMAVPRMLALAEVLWTPKEKRDVADFIRRLEAEFPRLEAMGVNASTSLYQISIRPKQGPKPGSIAVEMTSGSEMSISMTEMAPPYNEAMATLSVYTGPVTINDDRELHGWLQRESFTGPMSKRRFIFNLATARPITLSVQPNERYNEGGAFTLVDGITAQDKRVNTEWLGWREGVTITVDLGIVQEISRMSIGALNETHSWIHPPQRVDFSVSDDGKTFMPFGTAEFEAGVGRSAFALENAGKARYVRFTVKHIGKIPEGFPGAGNLAWLFMDEIEVR